MTAAAIVDYVTETTGGATPVVVTPTTAGGTAIQNGDLMIALASGINGITQFNTPTGWTALTDYAVTGTLCMRVFAKVRAPGDGAVEFTVAGASAKGVTILWIRGWKGSLDDLIVGAVGLRPVTGTSTTSVAPSITLDTEDTLVVTLASERTTAVEAFEPFSNDADTWLWLLWPPGGDLESQWIGHSIKGEGATGTVTITYPNVQANNGIAVQLGVPPSDGPPPEPAGFAPYVRVGGVEHELTPHMKVAGVERELTTGIGDWPVGLANIDEMLALSPFRWAHRGGSQSWPEMTMYAYEQAARAGADALEISMWRSSDGVWVAHHDDTTLRVTGVNHDISTTPWATMESLMINPPAQNPGQPARPICTVEEILDKFLDTHLIVLDTKPVAFANITETLAMLANFGSPTDRVIWKNFNQSVNPANRLKDAGYLTWGYFYDSQVVDFPERMAVWDMIGLNWDASVDHWNEALSYDKPVVGFIIGNDTQANTALGKGAHGLQVARWH